MTKDPAMSNPPVLRAVRDDDAGVPISVKIRERVRQAQQRFHANDNIAAFIEPGELEKLLDEVRGNFQAFLADRKNGQPFCYWFGPTLTHRSYEKHSGVNLWGITPDDLKGRLPAFLPDVPEVRS